MDDLISRQAAIDFIDAGRLCNPNEPRWSDNEVVNFLKTRPSAQPERWIPVTERLPGYGEGVIANFRNEQIGRDRIGVSYCYVQKEGFFSDVPFEYKVVAWMPLPEPWEGEENDNL